MNVTLVHITPYAEQTITDIARVSNPANKGKDGTKLISYLIENGHWSPFEHAFATFEIETSLAVATQILRHRSFTFQQFSQRYSKAVGFEYIELRKQAEINRQSSTEIMDDLDLRYGIDYLLNAVVELYNKMLEAGVAKEQARMVLPQCTTTTLFVSGPIRSWLHYLKLRLDEHTQKEHRLVAEEVQAQLWVHCPVICQAYFGAVQAGAGK